MLVPCGSCNEGLDCNGNPCDVCSGAGEVDLLDPAFIHISNPNVVRGILWDAVLTNTTMPDNVFRSYQVLECLDATEHSALTDTQKDGVLHILACGWVDLNDGKAGKVRLWSWFGAESDTVANLTALMA